MVRKHATPSKSRRRPATTLRKRTRREKAIASALDSLNQLEPRTSKADKAIALLKSWLVDESGYDEQTWPELKAALDERRSRVGARSLFNG